MAGLNGASNGTLPFSRLSRWGLTFWPPQRAAEALLRRKLARDVFWLQASNTLQKGYGFVFSVLAVRLLGVAGYGEFLAIQALYQTVNLLGNLGLGQFMVVPMAQAAATGNRAELARASGYNLKVSAVVALLVMIVALAAGPWLAGAWYGNAELGRLMRIVALGGLPAVAYNVATTALQAARRMGHIAAVENVDAIAGRALGIAAMLAGWGLAGLLWGMLVGDLIATGWSLYWYRRVAVEHHGFPDFRALLHATWQVPLRRYLRFSALAVADKNVAQLFAQTPVLFLGRWAGDIETGYFGVAAKVFTLLAAFHGAMSKALSVRLSQELAQRGPAATRRLFWRTSLLWGGLSTLAALGLALLLPLFRLVYGAQALPSVTLVVLLAALAAKQGFTVSLGSIFLIMDRVATNMLAKLPLIAVAMPVGAWMVQRWGAVGAAGYQLGAFAAGDALYFAILLTPWFWKERRR
jgi:O-antigen/teichoic acid export membrane protein